MFVGLLIGYEPGQGPSRQGNALGPDALLFRPYLRRAEALLMSPERLAALQLSPTASRSLLPLSGV